MRFFGWFRRPPAPVPESSWLPDLQFVAPQGGIYELQPASAPSDVWIAVPGAYRLVRLRPIVVESEERVAV